MIKYDLTEKGYFKTEKIMNNSILRIFWAFFTIAASVFTFWLAWILFAQNQSNDIRDGGSFAATLDNSLTLVYFFLIPIGLTIYLIFTRFLMKSFCKNKSESMSVRSNDTITLLPMSYCREALKPWQFVVTYAVSLAVVYIPLFTWWFLYHGVGTFVTIFFIMIYVAPDIVLVFYILYVKLTEGADYISVDDHIRLTLYSKDNFWKRKAL